MKISGFIGNGSNRARRLLMLVMLVVLVVLVVSGFAILTSERHRDTVASLEGRDARGSGIAPSSSGVPSVRAGRLPMPGAPRKVRAYYANASLSGQLSILREMADKGDAHAACVLSRSLLLCKRLAMDSPLSRFSDHYLTSLGKKESESFTKAIASYEMAAYTICDGVDEASLDEMDGRIIQSAASGDQGAMRMLAMPQYNPRAVSSQKSGSRFYSEKNREDLLAIMNDAADSGDPKALEMIFVTYSTGLLVYAHPRVEVDADPVRAIAAFRALMAVGDYYFKSRYDPDYFAEVEKSNERIVASLSEVDKARLKSEERAYILAYRAEDRASSVEEELFNELPEQACAKVDSTNRSGPSSPVAPAMAGNARS